MLRASIDARPLIDFAREFGRPDWNPKCMRRALQGETFRLFKYSQDQLNEGSHWPRRAKMTKEVAKRKGETSLFPFSPMLSYMVLREGPMEGWIGWALGAVRRKRVPLGWLSLALAGHSFTVQREHQIAIVRKLLGYRTSAFTSKTPAAVKRARGKIAKKRRALGRDEIKKLIPRVGTTIKFPKREALDIIIHQQAPLSERNIARLYQQAINGQRWAKEWWKPKQLTLAGI